MIEQYLSNKNESATVAKSKKNSQLNKTKVILVPIDGADADLCVATFSCFLWAAGVVYINRANVSHLGNDAFVA